MLLVVLFVPYTTAAYGSLVTYDLAVSFDTKAAEITGTAKITIPKDQKLSLHLSHLQITGAIAEDAKGHAAIYQLPLPEKFIIPAVATTQTISLSYRKHIGGHGLNKISSQGITLLSGWYPQPEQKVRYTLQAKLPQGFTAIAESETFPLPVHNQVATARSSRPLCAIHFAAGPYITAHKEVRPGLVLSTMFFPEDQALATSYLDKGATYITDYEQQIGPFPYNHYVIVANRNPTGLGLPTFTLLGQMVLRLPFITDTSLRHEILHSWFGNSIAIAQSSGNWCEGLTSYLADHAHRKEQQQGSQYRLETIRNYLSYTGKDSTLNLRNFHAADHNGIKNRQHRAVGYDRAMMLFHELHEKIGDTTFRTALQNFFHRYAHSEASWDDLRKAFEESSQIKLATFFQQRLERTDIPSLGIDSTQVKLTRNGHIIHLTIQQYSNEPYEIVLPIDVETAEGHETFSSVIAKQSETIELKTKSRPLAVAIDPEYSMLRQLDDAEYAPCWSSFLGSEDKLIVSTTNSDRFAPLIKILGDSSWNIKADQDIKNSALSTADLLFLGTESKACRSLFGKTPLPDEGFILDVHRNPLNPEKVAVLVNSESSEQSQQVARRLLHYGKYAFLQFAGRRLIERRLPPPATGIRIEFETPLQGGATTELGGLKTLAKQIAKHQVIYLGETHTSTADHHLQLKMIEAIAPQVEHPVIAMEMFPTTSQKALNAYIFTPETMSERQFLKASRYYQVWNYDFRYFREIFRFAQKHRIPVIALNLERNIVSQVFKTGSLDRLSDDQQQHLPENRNLALPGYSKRLSEVYQAHAHHSQGNPAGFIQAQALWDETMATNIAGYLKGHPEATILVLAGSEHTRKDSGIPPRVAARLPVRQASVLNLSDSNIPDNLNELADYYFFADKTELPPQGKLGILLKKITVQEKPAIKITGFTKTSKAPKTGLKAEDIILSIDDFPIHAMADVHIAMLDAQPGKNYSITYKRKEKDGEHIKTTTVELIAPQTPRGHR